MKSNYGVRGGKIDLEWKNGLFVPIRAKTRYEKAASDQKIDETFLRLLKTTRKQRLHYSPNSGRSYAPAKFAERDDCDGFTSPQFAKALERLLNGGKIIVEEYGRPAQRSKRLILPEERETQKPSNDHRLTTI